MYTITAPRTVFLPDNNGTLMLRGDTITLSDRINADKDSIALLVRSTDKRLSQTDAAFLMIPNHFPLISQTTLSGSDYLVRCVAFNVHTKTTFTIINSEAFRDTGAGLDSLAFGIYTLAGNLIVQTGWKIFPGATEISVPSTTLPVGSYFYAWTTAVETVGGAPLKCYTTAYGTLGIPMGLYGTVLYGNAANPSTPANAMPNTLGTITRASVDVPIAVLQN